MPSQQPPPPALDPVHVRAPEFTPGHGPHGTEVTVRSRDLPALTPIYLGMGAARSSFEVLAELVTTEQGEMSHVVRVPEWASTDRSHYFVLADVYFRPLAVSTAFHVTDPDGVVVRTGRITDEGVTCPVLREDGNEATVYTLAGAPGDLAPGDAVQVTGTIADASICMQGTTIEVRGVARHEDPAPAR